MSNSTTATLEDLLAHTGWARRLAQRLAGDGDAAEDLLQETLIAAAQHPPGSDRPLRPWLAVVLRNLFFKSRLAERRRQARQAAGSGAANADDSAASPEALSERVQMQRLLAEVVGRLDEPYRQTVILRYFEELTSAQIARRMDVPAATVRWRLGRAIEQMKQQLDERHEGGRATWMAAILPLTRPAVPRPRLWVWLWPVGLAVVLSVVMVAGTLVQAGRGRGWFGAPSSGTTAGDPARTILASSSRRGPGPAPERAQAALVGGDDTWASCRIEVGRLRIEQVEVERARRAGMNIKDLFALGHENPGATAALTPAIDRLLQGGHPVAPSHTLECHTHACRLVVLTTNEESENANEWILALQDDAELKTRRRGMSFHASTPRKDPVSGVALDEHEIFVRLADPSGAKVPDGQPVANLVEISDAPLPGDRASCLREREQARAAVQAGRAAVDRQLPYGARFDRGAPNPRLRDELRAHLTSVFRDRDASGLDVRCQAQICRVTWPQVLQDPNEDWQDRFYADPWTEAMVKGSALDRAEVLLEVTDQPRASGMKFLRDLVAGVVRSGALDGCAARFPARGKLVVRLQMPAIDPRRVPDEPPQIETVYGETLAGTPLGQCLQAAIDAGIAASPLPTSAMADAMLFQTFTFPRPPPPPR